MDEPKQLGSCSKGLAQFSVNVLLNVPPPSLVVTPFSEKQPPPNDSPIVEPRALPVGHAASG